jgi:hypothetical protein
MAKFLSTTFGKISGKHGTAVAAVMNGKSVIKVFTPPSNPNSPAQQAQRLKFGLGITALNPLRNIIRIGFGNKQGYNQAVSLALRTAMEGIYPDFKINYAKVLVASGSLPQSPNVAISVVPGTGAEVTWDTTTWNSGSADDAVHIGFLNPATQMPVFVEAQAKRLDGKLSVALPGTWKGAAIHAWLFFTSADFQQSSVSQYLGTIVPA